MYTSDAVEFVDPDRTGLRDFCRCHDSRDTSMIEMSYAA